MVQSWSDTQIVALVAAGAASGNAQVLQNGVFSPAIPFTVNTLQLASINPTSGLSGTSVTFTGAGFGSLQGSGIVWLGSTAGQVLSWSDTQVVAAVAPTALTGIARVQQNGVWSNSFGFTVPVSGGNTVMPAMLNMVVGDTHTIQALSPTGHSVTGLTWTSSNPTVVSLSTDDPPLLTALAAGHVTITAGTASADVTVFAVALAPGTVVWSNPGDGSGVTNIVPAVPSASGVADVFAFQNDGTVQAITSDGTTAWTADVSQATGGGGIGPELRRRVRQSRPTYSRAAANALVVPDFQGGLVVLGQNSIWKLDGITGQPYPAYTFETGSAGYPVVHPDGTVFIIDGGSLVAIDPTTGTRKFGAPIGQEWEVVETFDLIVAGDGYVYQPYVSGEPCGGDDCKALQLRLLRVNSSGASDDIHVADWTGGAGAAGIWDVNTITNADMGILLTWETEDTPLGMENGHWRVYMAITAGTSVSLVSAPVVPGQSEVVVPVLQAQDGSFVGTTWTNPSTAPYMVSFDATGNVLWAVPNEQPQIATADGGVIGRSGTTYDQNGNATGQMNLLTQSWTGNSYQYGSVDQVYAVQYLLGASFMAIAGGQFSPGVAFIPLDAVSTHNVNGRANGLLNATTWQNFKGSNCAAVFKAVMRDASPPLFSSYPPYQAYDPSMHDVQQRQATLDFYDTGNKYIAPLTLSEITGGKIASIVKLPAYLSNVGATAATPLLGQPGPIILVANFFNSPQAVPYPKITLVHEVLLHAYAGLSDSQVLGNAYFASKGLVNGPSSNITGWMSTDCTCTPGPNNQSCTAGTASWGK